MERNGNGTERERNGNATGTKELQYIHKVLNLIHHIQFHLVLLVNL